MADYTSLGIDKLTQQANTDVTLVRCPRDGVVMRVLGCRAARRDGSGEECRVVGRLPRGRLWTVRELDLECPACARRARGITVGADAAGSPSAREFPLQKLQNRHFLAT